MSFTRLIAACCFFFLCTSISAQDGDSAIDYTFERSTLFDAIRTLEDQYDIKIFHDTSLLENKEISATFEGVPLLKVFNERLLIGNKAELVHVASSVYVILPTDRELVLVKEHVLSGTVAYANSKQAVPFATIQLPELATGTISDSEGKFSIVVPEGIHRIIIKSADTEDNVSTTEVFGDTSIDFELFEQATQLDDVIVFGGERNDVSESPHTGKLEYSIESIRKLPTLLGEPDIGNIILSMPGIQNVGEGATGFNVRGGSIDQNLILWDGAPVYNSSHLLGFVSSFNSDVASNFSVYKGNMPAKYGGKLSSVIDVQVRNPDLESFKMQGGIGLLTSKLSLSTPIVKQKLAISGGFRYSDLTYILRSIEEVKESAADFQEFNSKIWFQPNEKNTLSTTVYSSADFFDLGSDTTFNYNSTLGSFRWNHQISPELIGSIENYFSIYEASSNNLTEDRESTFTNGVETAGSRLLIDFTRTENLSSNVGAEGKWTRFNVGTVEPSANSLQEEIAIPSKQTLETALFGEVNYQLNERIGFLTGFRVSNFSVRDNEQLVYDANLPRSSDSVVDTLTNSGFSRIQTAWSPRISLNWEIGYKKSIKTSYTRNVQFEHLFSASAASLPTDLWLPSSINVTPSTSDQFSIGYYQDLRNLPVQFSIEVYQKVFSGLNIPKTGALILANPFVESEIIPGEGRSSGMELFLRKVTGKFTGSVSYTLSRAEVRTTSRFSNENINRGDYFLADFDRTHNLNVSTGIELSRLWSFSSNIVFNTGRPATIPGGSYLLNGIRLFDVSDRNNIRIPNTFRLDISFTLEGNNKKNSTWRSNFTFSVYNLLSNENPFTIYTNAVRNSNPRTFRVTVFGNAIPSLTYNFRFNP